VYHYLDDFVIYSENFDDHVRHIREVLSRLKEAGLTVRPSKVRFATTQLSFLGHIVSHNGVSIDSGRTSAIRDFPPPSDVKGTARFFGMVNFFNKFIPNVAHRAASLNHLRKKGV
jgi:hypothetical protein